MIVPYSFTYKSMQPNKDFIFLSGRKEIYLCAKYKFYPINYITSLLIPEYLRTHEKLSGDGIRILIITDLIITKISGNGKFNSWEYIKSTHFSDVQLQFASEKDEQMFNMKRKLIL